MNLDTVDVEKILKDYKKVRDNHLNELREGGLELSSLATFDIKKNVDLKNKFKETQGYKDYQELRKKAGNDKEFAPLFFDLCKEIFKN
ncbi:hypothetical protein [Tenacibaculum ovolyticum]|uniref:hypothetical protein n=1 Tax=Tenacibaculum ovolyticum TaxID=104270 RepID=UPI001F281C63|nr:hypothetical protein [Tenacibaculum ovolyticum]